MTKGAKRERERLDSLGALSREFVQVFVKFRLREDRCEDTISLSSHARSSTDEDIVRGYRHRVIIQRAIQRWSDRH